MRILLTSTAAFVPPRGGSTRSNRVWLEHMAWRGHHCHVVCGAAPASTTDQFARVQREAGSQGYVIDPADADAKLSLPSGIEVFLHRDLPRRAGVLAEHIRRFEPDWVLVSSEDLGQALLREASDAAPGRIVYIAHTPQFFPFGPESWSRDAHAASRVREAAAIVTIGHHMAAYVREHLGIAARVIHPPIYGSEPFESFANFRRGRALMVNPCAVKGLTIFMDVARSLPLFQFAVLPGWGTTAQDYAEIATLPHVAVLEPVRRIEQALEQVSVLLMPSLWFEGFGLIVMEAMLRGIPVISSDSGGLVEAKAGTSFVFPVNPIREYLAEFDEVFMPRPVIPPQDTAQWVAGLERLLSDQVLYETESERSREAALEFVYSLRASAMEELLLSLHPRRKGLPAGELSVRIDRLSPSQRASLLSRVQARKLGRRTVHNDEDPARS